MLNPGVDLDRPGIDFRGLCPALALLPSLLFSTLGKVGSAAFFGRHPAWLLLHTVGQRPTVLNIVAIFRPHSPARPPKKIDIKPQVQI